MKNREVIAVGKRFGVMRQLLAMAFLCVCLAPARADYRPKSTQKCIDALQIAAAEYKLLVASLPDTTTFPRRTKSATDATLVTVKAGDWTSGFFPGALWYLYQYTADDFFRRNALRWTGNIKTQTKNTGTGHDLGFIFNCSFGNAYRLYGHPGYPAVMLEAGTTLSNRFSTVVGCTKSWNSGSWPSYSNNTGKWQFPVIIDNMMNMELLLKMTQFNNDSLYYRQAVKHAATTTLAHIRPDSSTFHVVDFDPLTGNILGRGTRQGFSDASCWSRGQAWGIYGYSMMYKYTNDTAHLNTSKRLLGYYLKHKPADHIPFWDYQSPDLPDTYRDASAAAITCAALLDLYVSTSDTAYLVYAEQIIDELTTPYYLNTTGTNAHLLLKHSTGGTNGYEADVAQTYADYYFIEALVKYLQLDPAFVFPNHPPHMHTGTLPDANQNSWYSFQLTAFDLEDDALAFSSQNLPDGLSLTNSGILSGSPENAGSYNIVVDVNDGSQTVSFPVKLKVNSYTTGSNTPNFNALQCSVAGNGIVVDACNDMADGKTRVSVFLSDGRLATQSVLKQKNQAIPVPHTFKGQVLFIRVAATSGSRTFVLPYK